MGRKSIDAVLARVVGRGGSINFRDFETLLLRLGFTLDRSRGSHRIYCHPKAARPLSIQPRGREAKPYQARQLRI
ncbi:hypothetical protein BH10PSE9_BH10PSE9_08180 [soil metagenome]